METKNICAVKNSFLKFITELSIPLDRLKNNSFFTNSTLKFIAIFTMIIDHAGAALMLRTGLASEYTSLYIYLRAVGRIAFPIFAFLLVQGFVHTKNFKKYATSLFIFALISEIPFDLAIRDSLVNMKYQNIFFTLFTAVCMLKLMDLTKKHVYVWPIIVGAASYIAHYGGFDYGYKGILAIAFLYLTRNYTIGIILTVLIAFYYESGYGPGFVYLSLIPIILYNGKKGLSIKYFFYVFYPAHLLVLYLIRFYMIG